MTPAPPRPPQLSVKDLTIGYGNDTILENLAFEVEHGSVFIIMGASGCGKSTLLRHLIGLSEPIRGEIRYSDRLLTGAPPAERAEILRDGGVLFQGSALWSELTVEENVALPLEQLTDLGRAEARALARLKLGLVGLTGTEDLYPSQLSGGMQKRAGLARAIALDPETLFLDEPSAGLDPLSSRRLDDLILELRDTLGVTVVIVTHELASIFAIGTTAIFLDAQTRSILARGSPAALRDTSSEPQIRSFLTRSREAAP